MKDLLFEFMTRIEKDPTIDSKHISLFMAFYKIWADKGYNDSFVIYTIDVMRAAKISSVATYARKVKDLHNRSYIKYKPSHSIKVRTSVSLLP